MLQVRLFRIYNMLLRFLLRTDAIVQSKLCFSKCGLLLCDMTTGPCSCSSPCLGPPLPYLQNVQIQSITDESRSSIRRKNQGPGLGTSLSRQSSLMDDTQEDEVAHFLTPTVPHCPTPRRLIFTKLNLWMWLFHYIDFNLRNLPVDF